MRGHLEGDRVGGVRPGSLEEMRELQTWKV